MVVLPLTTYPTPLSDILFPSIAYNTVDNPLSIRRGCRSATLLPLLNVVTFQTWNISVGVDQPATAHSYDPQQPDSD